MPDAACAPRPAIARRMFADLWAHRAQQAETQAKAMTVQLVKVESRWRNFWNASSMRPYPV
ncbi:hypothetical protein ACO2Q5_20325 [Neotabrizicola sp. VNH66]